MTDKEEIERLKNRLAEVEHKIAQLTDKNFYEDEDDYDDRGYDEDEEKEKQYEELAERAASCKCGAWQFNKKGDVIHVADCCCGAE